MKKKAYKQPKTKVYEFAQQHLCAGTGVGDQTGSGGTASLDLQFEEVPEERIEE